jgi:DNA-binding transcriptional MocR family regulator
MISVSQADEQSVFFRYWIFTYIKKQEELEMKSYEEMTKEELLKEKEGLEAEYKKFQQRGLKLDMSRGKPSQEQLDLSMGMMDVLTSGVDLTCDDGTDCRNYGVLDGISEAKQLIGDMIECNPDNIIIYGNSSLNIMYDTISRSMTHGVMGNTPWCKLDKVKFLCPVPGYDRHFAITEYFGIEMINVPMLPTGPDMDMVEDLVSKDEAIKGIWCVPKYSNPQGITYSDETVRRFARLKPAAKDFRIYWDNAYCVHHLYDINQDHLIEILKECKRAGNPDMVYKFCSTSKITFPGSGVAAIATSANNLEDIKKQLKIQTIGHDKVNQLRHVRFFKDIHGITEHMRKHADSLRPKFEMILDTFERELKGLGAGSWYSPKGGYFITYETLDGCAKNVVAKAKKAGVVMTPAGAPFPYGKDPHDSVIRISPSYPSLEDLTTAIDIFVVCVKLASIEKLLGE